MFAEDKIPATFIQYASKILGDTNRGLSGRVIVDETAAYAVEYDVEIPHPIYPFEASSKRQALFDKPSDRSVIQLILFIVEFRLLTRRRFTPPASR